MNELNELIKQRMELKKQVDALEESKKEVENRIKLMIELENINEYEDESGNYLTYKEIVTNRLDKKLVEQKLAPELFT
jgi:predicted phage-related endonuclease